MPFGLGKMFYARQASHNLEKMPIVSVSINMNVIEVENDTKMIKITTCTKTSNSKEREGTNNVSLEKSEDWVTARTRFGRKVGKKSGTFDLATGTTVKWSDRLAATSDEVPDGNYYDVLGINKDEERVFEESHNKVIKYINVGAGVGGGFSNTQELRVMKYHEAINGPDGELWKEEVNKEHNRLINSFSVGGCTRHIDVKQCFLQELKETKQLIVEWIPGSENNADMFTKNLDGPLFKKYAEQLLGEGALNRDTPSKGGV